MMQLLSITPQYGVGKLTRETKPFLKGIGL
jgi:hypothetical protein